MKGGSAPKRVFVQMEGNTDREAHYIVPTGVLFLKATKGEFYFLSYWKTNYTFDQKSLHFSSFVLHHLSICINSYLCMQSSFKRFTLLFGVTT